MDSAVVVAHRLLAVWCMTLLLDAIDRLNTFGYFDP